MTPGRGRNEDGEGGKEEEGGEVLRGRLTCSRAADVAIRRGTLAFNGSSLLGMEAFYQTRADGVGTAGAGGGSLNGSSVGSGMMTMAAGAGTLESTPVTPLSPAGSLHLSPPPLGVTIVRYPFDSAFGDSPEIANTQLATDGLWPGLS